MNMIQAVSSNILAFGFEQSKGDDLFVEFIGGAVYVYHDVQPEKFETMRAFNLCLQILEDTEAQKILGLPFRDMDCTALKEKCSLGKYLNAEIKPHHQFEKVIS